MGKFDTNPQSTLGEEWNDLVNVLRELGATDEDMRQALLADVEKGLLVQHAN